MTPDVFDALANPIRRDLLARLRTGPQPVKALVPGHGRGRPAISEHLRVLREAGLVHEVQRGRERYYHLDAAPLRAVSTWLADYEAFWADRLTTLSTLLDEEPP